MIQKRRTFNISINIFDVFRIECIGNITLHALTFVNRNDNYGFLLKCKKKHSFKLEASNTYTHTRTHTARIHDDIVMQYDIVNQTNS